jgi:HK97 gp10 family phage protein
MSGNPISLKIVGIPELKKALDRLDDVAAEKNLRAAGQAGGQIIRNRAKQLVRKKSGTLNRSIHSLTVELDRNHVVVEIGTNLEYAKIHEYGGTIKPKKAKFLAVPLTEEARRYVSPRLFPRELHPVIHDDKGTLRDADGTAHYALVKSVTITAQPYMRPAWDEKRDEAVREMGEVLKQLLKEVAS